MPQAGGSPKAGWVVSTRRRRALQTAGTVVASLVGATVGIGAFTFLYAEGASYLTDDPRACANCHVMQSHYDAWLKSSHRHVANCNDCHTPHGFFGKYWVKARNGYHHSMAFTLGGFPEPIRITEANRRVTEGACRHCHESIVRAIDGVHQSAGPLDCIRCHSEVGHSN